MAAAHRHALADSPQPVAARGELAQALAAVRARLGLIALLFVLAGTAWWATAERMAGMDAGPGTDLGALGWFLGAWVVMMAAMMFPSVAPTVALFSRMTARHGITRPLMFSGGYLAVWSAAGLASFAFFAAGRGLLGDQLAWDRAGRWLAAGTLFAAATYELTPVKDACLSRCRSPLGFLLGNWRDGARGALTMGTRHGAWCLGCCWALMAALFALGVMSLTWMVVVAALIALEKTLPWARAATWSTTLVLVVLAVWVAAAPGTLPGLTVPDDDASPGIGQMQTMR